MRPAIRCATDTTRTHASARRARARLSVVAVGLRQWRARVSAPLLIAVLVVTLVWPSMAAAAPPVDPKQMSGMGRVDPNVPVGTVIVRCLLGDFEHPAVGIDVDLVAVDAQGKVVKTARITTDEAGRATFAELSELLGAKVTVSASLDGELQVSQALPLDAAGGTRVMLVKGAHTEPAGGGHGDAGMPEPGHPFPIKSRPPGTLRIGTFDIGARAPRQGVLVTLDFFAEQADETPIETREGTSDETGSVDFTGLDQLPTPVGAWLQVRGVVVEGRPPLVSERFQMPADTAIAIVLVEGLDTVRSDSGAMAGVGGTGTAAGGRGASPRQPSRPALPRPMAMQGEPPGSVEAIVVDAHDRPVKDQEVWLIERDMTGAERRIRGETDARGRARMQIDERRPDALYMVRTLYDDAPFESPGFSAPDNSGARVVMRVFNTTTDRSRVRSALQWRLVPLENDHVQVMQFFEVMVDGDEAFWQPGGLRISGAPGRKNVRVHPDSSDWLSEDGKAPWAELRVAIPPGEVVSLSVDYVVAHDGEAALSWIAPFPVVAAAAVLEDEQVLLSGRGGPSQSDPHQQGLRGGALTMVPLAIGDWVGGPCARMLAADETLTCSSIPAAMAGTPLAARVGGLPRRPVWPRWSAIGVVVALGLAVGLALLVMPRLDTRTRLERRRTLLRAALDEIDPSQSERWAAAESALASVEAKLSALSHPARRGGGLGPLAAEVTRAGLVGSAPVRVDTGTVGEESAGASAEGPALAAVTQQDHRA